MLLLFLLSFAWRPEGRCRVDGRMIDLLSDEVNMGLPFQPTDTCRASQRNLSSEVDSNFENEFQCGNYLQLCRVQPTYVMRQISFKASSHKGSRSVFASKESVASARAVHPSICGNIIHVPTAGQKAMFRGSTR